MRNWSDSPFGRTVKLADVGRYTEADVIAQDKGEALVIYELPGHPGWLSKLYKPETKVDHGVLSTLIDLPGTMPDADLALVDHSVAWPVAQVLDGYRPAGVIMAKATPEFSWDISLLGGRTKRQTVEIDLLAISADRIKRLGIPVPTPAARLAAVGNIVAVAALFERHDVVYGDWSFANAFWSPRTNAILIIDMDASGIKTRRFVETPSWEDPQVQRGRPLTTHTDRYKVALLVARALTGDRADGQAAAKSVAALYPSGARLAALLHQSLTAPSGGERPTLAELYDAIEKADTRPSASIGGGGANVTGTIPWNPPSRRRAAPIRTATPRPTPRLVQRTASGRQTVSGNRPIRQPPPAYAPLTQPRRTHQPVAPPAPKRTRGTPRRPSPLIIATLLFLLFILIVAFA
jgi:hypothetical protein